METLLYALIFVVIPVAAFWAFKRLIVGYLVASFSSAALVVCRMVYLEAHAADREFDFIFCVSVFIWSMIAFILYLPYMAAARFIRNKFKCKI